jgi:hypothetical protein
MNLAEVVKRAKVALNAKPQRKTETVYIGSIDADVVFHSVTMQEKSELLAMAKSDDRLWMRKMILAGSEDLRRIAVELVKSGALVEPEGVVGIISEADQLKVFQMIEKLSAEESNIVIGGKAAKAVKNS